MIHVFFFVLKKHMCVPIREHISIYESVCIQHTVYAISEENKWMCV